MSTAGKRNFLVKLIKNTLLNGLVNLNQQSQKSFALIVIFQIVHFILGSSQIYCIFVMRKLNQNTNQPNVYNFIENFIQQYYISNNFAIFLSMLLIVLVQNISLAFLLNHKIVKALKLQKCMYFIFKFMKIFKSTMFSIFAMLVYNSIFISQDYEMIPMTILLMVQNVLLYTVTGLFQQKNYFEREDMISHNYCWQAQIIDSILCFFSFIGTFVSLIRTDGLFHEIIAIAWIGLLLLKMKYTVIWPYYQVPSVQKVYCLVLSLQFIQTVVFTINYYARNQLISQNLILIIIVSTILINWSLDNYIYQLRQDCVFWNADEIKSANQFYFQINSYYQLLKKLDFDVQTSLVGASLKRKHQSQCKFSNCFCRQISSLHSFISRFILLQLKTFKIIFKNNNQIRLYISSFQFHANKFYIEVCEDINYYQSKIKLNIFDIFKIEILKKRVNQWISYANRQNQSLRIDMALQLEAQMWSLNQIIVEDIKIKKQKWESLNHNSCRKQQIQQFSEKQISNFLQITNIKQSKLSIYRKCFIFNATLYFYYKRIVLKTHKLNDLQENIKQLSKNISEQKISHSLQLQKLVFHSNSCVIQTSIEQKGIGNISNVSKNVLKVFGYQPQNMIEQNISYLIPSFLKENHDEIMKQWIRNGGNLSKISKINQIFCLHKDKYCFSALKYMKIYFKNSNLSIITYILKLNQNDMLLIDNNFVLRQYGKNYQNNIKYIPHNVQINYVFKDMIKKLSHSLENQFKNSQTILFSSLILKKLLKRKNSLKVRADDGIFQSNPERIYEQVIKTLENSWKIHFGYKKIKKLKGFYFVIYTKTLELIKHINSQSTKKIICQDEQLSNFQNTSIIDIQKQQQYNLQNVQLLKAKQISSLASTSSSLGYNIYKLIQNFEYVLVHPIKFRDNKTTTKLILDIFFFTLLLSIGFCFLFVGHLSCEDKVSALRHKSYIDKTFHLIEISTNCLLNMYQQRNNPMNQILFMEQMTWNSERFNNAINQHFLNLQAQLSPLKNLALYSYLRTPLVWYFSKTFNKTIHLVQFFKMIYYLSSQIKEQVNLKSQNKTYDYKTQFLLLTLNLPTLRDLRTTLISIADNENKKDNQMNQNILIMFVIAFAVISFVYLLYCYLYRRYRFNQRQQHLNIYRKLSNQIVEILCQYYTYYEQVYGNKNKRIDTLLINQTGHAFEKDFLCSQIQSQGNQFNCNKIKFIGNRKQAWWLFFTILFVILNGFNTLIVYNLYLFNNEIAFFTTLTNSISEGQSILLNRFMRLKGTYYFQRQLLTQSFLDKLLSTAGTSEPNFNRFVTFDPNWVMTDDSIYRRNFNNLLLSNVCDLNRDSFNDYQILVCNKYADLSKNGILVFVNGLSRSAKNKFMYFKKYLSTIVKSSNDEFSSLAQFQQYQIMLTFHINTFGKLTAQIIQAYQNGFLSQFNSCAILFSVLCSILLVFLILNINYYYTDKSNIIKLYGYILLVPSISLKQNKHLAQFIRFNLDFQSKF